MLAAAALVLVLGACVDAERIAAIATPTVDPVGPTPTGSRSPSPATTEAPPALVPCGDVFTGEPPPGWETTLTVDKDRYAVGEVIAMTIGVRNGTDEPFEHIVGYTIATFGIARAGESSLVWHSFWGQGVPASARSERFAPQEAKSHRGTWGRELCRTSASGEPKDPGLVDGVLPPGRYEAYGLWAEEWAAGPVPFEISP